MWQKLLPAFVRLTESCLTVEAAGQLTVCIYSQFRSFHPFFLSLTAEGLGRLGAIEPAKPF